MVHESGRPERMESYEGASSPSATILRELGIRSSVGAPIVVDGRLWGVMIASSKAPAALPADTESRIAGFTELVATAISNTESRNETRRLAEEQAALRSVATAAVEGVPPSELFGAVVGQVGVLFGADLATLLRYEDEETAELVATWTAAGRAPHLVNGGDGSSAHDPSGGLAHPGR
jgi:GAF domain-containing protein